VIPLSIPTIWMAILSLIYCKIDLFSGLISSVLYFTLLAISNNLYLLSLKSGNDSFHLKLSVAFFILNWILQFIGHGVFEKKGPCIIRQFTTSICCTWFHSYRNIICIGIQKRRKKSLQIVNRAKNRRI